MNVINTIKMSEIVPSAVSSRDIISKILETIIRDKKAAVIHLDFRKISFISRSAAHELLKMKERFEYSRKKKGIVFINVDDNVAEMIRLVGANMAYPNSEKPVYRPRKVKLSDLVKT